MGSVNPKESFNKYNKSRSDISNELDKLPKEGLSKAQNTRKKELLREKESVQKAID